MRKAVVLLSLLILVVGLTFFRTYSANKEVTKVPFEPDFTKVPQIKISMVTVYAAGKKMKVLDKGEHDFAKIEKDLFTPIAYSGLFEQNVEGQHIVRLPSLYVPPIEDLTNGKAYGHENATVIIIDLAKPIDMTFAKQNGGIPNEFTQLIFLPTDTNYNGVIVFGNATLYITTIPRKPYNSEIFKNLLTS